MLVRTTIRGVGYDPAPSTATTPTPARSWCTVKRQSRTFAMGVDTGGAGDQGLDDLLWR